MTVRVWLREGGHRDVVGSHIRREKHREPGQVGTMYGDWLIYDTNPDEDNDVVIARVVAVVAAEGMVAVEVVPTDEGDGQAVADETGYTGQGVDTRFGGRDVVITTSPDGSSLGSIPNTAGDTWHGPHGNDEGQ